MKLYKIKEVSRLTSLSIRTLQYYDDIDLLKPSQRTNAGYRVYSLDDLLRLQQITTLKFLGFSLAAIQGITQQPDFNLKKSLAIQADALTKQAMQINEASALLRYIAEQNEARQSINWYSTTQIIHLLKASTMSQKLKNTYENLASESELGRQSDFDNAYNPNRLYPIARAPKRQEINLDPTKIKFYGFDCWNHYEVSWLNPKGKPVVATAVITYDCHTPFIIESKSLKLYFNSLNNSTFADKKTIEQLLANDIGSRIGGEVSVSITLLSEQKNLEVAASFSGVCLDSQDIDCSVYLVNPDFLTTSTEIVDEILFSELLKSNCLVTNQPDWGSVQIAYRGQKIDHAGLLRYIVSFRNHNEFHEQCIERIFVDIMTRCKPESLTVYGRYTRRGGLDINPYRSTEPVLIDNNSRLIRQ